MGIFDSINISSTGLKAQRLRLDLISNNIANVNTTRTADGGPYKKNYIILRENQAKPNFKAHFLPEALKNKYPGNGVDIVKIEKSNKPFRLKHDPMHPDAIDYGDKKGYVLLPNVNVVEEMVDMISASRSYEANLSVIKNSKQMFMQTLNMGV